MPERDDPLYRIAEFVEKTNAEWEKIVETARAMERISAIDKMIEPAVGMLSSLLDLDGDLAPEANEAARLIGELLATTDRMMTFVTTRMQVSLERTLGPYGGIAEES